MTKQKNVSNFVKIFIKYELLFFLKSVSIIIVLQHQDGGVEYFSQNEAENSNLPWNPWNMFDDL